MGLFSRGRKAQAAPSAEHKRAEEAYADVILMCDTLSVDERAPLMAHAERLQVEIKRALGQPGAPNRLVQIESELRVLAQRARRRTA
ncbi:MAG: hypothetical protein ACI9U2_001720 [Bradymonadia bacterium]|jgi:hypothetical protein